MRVKQFTLLGTGRPGAFNVPEAKLDNCVQLAPHMASYTVPHLSHDFFVCFMLSFSHGPLAKQGDVEKEQQLSSLRRRRRGFVDKTEAWLAPGSGLLHSVYSSADDLYMNH